jgi:PAS domain S-box-containing protein
MKTSKPNDNAHNQGFISSNLTISYTRQFTNDHLFIELAPNNFFPSKEQLSLVECIPLDSKAHFFSQFNNVNSKNPRYKFVYPIYNQIGELNYVIDQGEICINQINGEAYLKGAFEFCLNANQLNQNQRFFQKAINSASIVSLTNLAGDILYVNDLFCKYSKYSKIELLGHNHRIVNSGFHSKNFFQEMWTTISSGEIWRGEIKNKAKDGTYYWVDTVISPVFNEKNEVIQYLSIRNLITEKKQSETILKQIYESTFIKSGNTFFSNLTHYFCDVLKFDYAMIGWYDELNNRVQSISMRLSGKEIEPINYILRDTPCEKIMLKKMCVYPNKVRQAYPNDIHLKTHEIEGYIGMPILNENNDIVGLLALMHKEPIKELFNKEYIIQFLASRISNEIGRWQAETNLKNSEELTNNLLSSLNSHIAVIDKDGYILKVNKAWTEFAQQNGIYDVKKIGVGANYLHTLIESMRNSKDTDAEIVLDGIEQIINNQSLMFQHEYRCDSEFEERWFLMTASKLTESNGHIVIRHVDITKHKKNELFLNQRQEHFKDVLQFIQEGILLLSKDFKIIYYNQAVSSFFNLPEFSVDNALDQTDSIIKFIDWHQTCVRSQTNVLPYMYQFEKSTFEVKLFPNEKTDEIQFIITKIVE